MPFMFSNLLHIKNYTDATHTMIMHDAVESSAFKNSFPDTKRDVEKLYSASILLAGGECATPSRLYPQGWEIQFWKIFYTFICSWWWSACRRADRKCWGELHFQSESFLLSSPCMMPQLLPCAETTRKHLLVRTNVLCDKDQKNIFIGPAAKIQNSLGVGWKIWQQKKVKIVTAT